MMDDNRKGASVCRTEARNATVGSKCRLGFFPADWSVRWWCGIIKGWWAGPRNRSGLTAVELTRYTRSGVDRFWRPVYRIAVSGWKWST